MNTYNEKIIVAINCAAFNHEPYIRECLEGFVMQKTNFRFVAIVHDDASTDRTADIIREYEAKYPEIIKPIYETENQYSKHDGSLGRIMNAAIDATGAKYVALCEGDDYWTDPYKLQKQVDAMEKNPLCTICFNRVQAVQKDGVTKMYTIPIMDCSFSEGVVSLNDLVREEFEGGNWCFHTSSFFIRNEVLQLVPKFQEKHVPSFPYGDMPLQLCALLKGDGFFISDIMGHYRVLSGGWNSTMQKNSELRIAMERKIIQGFKEFDRYTRFKYHKSIRKHILGREYYEVYNGNSKKIKFIMFNIPKWRKRILRNTKSLLRILNLKN